MSISYTRSTIWATENNCNHLLTTSRKCGNIRVMNGKSKSVRVSDKNHRMLKRVQKSSQVRVPLEALANAAIELGIVQLDIYKNQKTN